MTLEAGVTHFSWHHRGILSCSTSNSSFVFTNRCLSSLHRYSISLIRINKRSLRSIYFIFLKHKILKLSFLFFFKSKVGELANNKSRWKLLRQNKNWILWQCHFNPRNRIKYTVELDENFINRLLRNLLEICSFWPLRSIRSN